MGERGREEGGEREEESMGEREYGRGGRGEAGRWGGRGLEEEISGHLNPLTKRYNHGM